MHTLGAIGVAVLLTGLVCVPVRAAESQGTMPVPNSSQQTPVRNQILAQYKTEFARKDAASRLALSREFRRLAARSADDPVRRYVLLREARELAVNAGDFDAAFGAIDDTTRVYHIDGNELKVSALTDAMDRAVIPKPQLMDNYLNVAEAALSHGDVGTAFQASRLATQIARASRDRETIERAHQTDLRVHDARREQVRLVAAAHKLEADPQDPDANLLLGKYICFVREEWSEGLRLLARGADAKLKALAEQELQPPVDARGMLALADGWWDAPVTTLSQQDHVRAHALRWYRKALPELTGDDKARAEARVAGGK